MDSQGVWRHPTEAEETQIAFVINSRESSSDFSLMVPVRVNAKNRDEWFYRARFEQSGEDKWLLEYGLFSSAWQSPWFKQIVRRNVVIFLRWYNSRKISLGKTAKWLNENGPSPPKGTAWHKSTLRYLLAQPSHVEKEAGIKRVMRLLKGLRWAERNQQPWLDRITELSDSAEECARRVWEMHKLLLPPFQVLSAHLGRFQRKHERVADRFQRRGSAMQRRGAFGLRFFGTQSMPAKSLRDILRDAKSRSNDALPWVMQLEQLDQVVPRFLDFQPTKLDMELLGQHRTTEALLRILCRLEGISTRTARRYKSQVVQ